MAGAMDEMRRISQYWARKYATDPTVQSLRTDPSPMRCQWVENIQELYRHAPAADVTPGSVDACNILRDALLRGVASLGKDSKTAVCDSRTRDAVVCALNQTKDEESLALVLARASIQSPRVVTFAIYDSALRQVAQSSQRRLLRQIVARLGTCVSLPSGSECMGTALNLSEEWLFSTLSSSNIDVQSRDSGPLCSLVCELLEREPNELEAPLRMDVCLSSLAPHLWKNTGEPFVARFLIFACMQVLSSSKRNVDVFLPSGIGLLKLLLDMVRVERRSMCELHRSSIDQTSESLDEASSLLLWEHGLPTLSFAPWPGNSGTMWWQHLWLWSRGCGDLTLEESWHNKSPRAHQGDLSAQDSLFFAEEVFVILAVCPDATQSCSNMCFERSMAIRKYVESRIVLARLPLTSEDVRIVWLVSFARQLGVLSCHEHGRLNRALPDLLRRIGICLHESAIRESLIGDLYMSCQFHVDALAVLLASRRSSVNDVDASSIYGPIDVPPVFESTATRRTCEVLQLSIVKVSSLQESGLDSKLEAEFLVSMCSRIFDSGLVCTDLQTISSICFDMLGDVLLNLARRLGRISSLDVCKLGDMKLASVIGVRNGLVDAKIAATFQEALLECVGS